MASSRPRCFFMLGPVGKSDHVQKDLFYPDGGQKGSRKHICLCFVVELDVCIGVYKDV